MMRDKTIFKIPQPLRAATPADTMMAPIMPPIRACDELEGMPTHQVRRFQMIAPTRPAMMIISLTKVGEMTMSPPIVLATPVEIMAPRKLRIAVPTMATPGRMARVDTQVAMALAVSWKPLMKSKTRARMTTMTMSDVSSIFHGHLFDGISQGFDVIRRFFQGPQDVFPADDIEQVRLISAEQPGNFLTVNMVYF